MYDVFKLTVHFLIGGHMDDFEYEILVEDMDSEISESASIRLLHFSKGIVFSKLNKVQILKKLKILNIVFDIEKTFLLITELNLSSFCLILWKQLIEIKNDLKKEMFYSYELNFAFDDLIYLARFYMKGGDSRGLIQ
jgi:hypothetical protein